MPAWLLAASFLLLASQATPPRDGPAKPDTGPGVVRGRVIAAGTGQPLHRVRLTLNGLATPPSIGVTNTRGEFEITGVPAGSYSIRASRAGYLSIQYGQRRPQEAGRTIEVAAGQVVEGIDLALPRAAVLSGTITDDVGEAYPGVKVDAVEFRYVRGRRVPLQVASANTNDLGEFRLSGLAPGVYLLRASTFDTWEGDEGHTYAAIPTYYPGMTTLDEAERLTLVVGQELSNLNFGLRPGRTARLTGTIQSANGEPMAMQAVGLDRAIRFGANLALAFGASARTGPDGTFEVRNLAPGEYMVYSGSDANRMQATVTLTAGDVRHVVLSPRGRAALTGSVVTDEGAPPPFSGARLSVTAVGLDADRVLPSVTAPSAATVGRDWTFRLSNMDGQYLFRVTGLPSEWMLAAVRLDGRNVTDSPAAIHSNTGAASPLQIVVSRRGGRIDGRVTHPDGTPAPDSAVVVFAADSARWTLASRYVKSVRPDNAGRFSIGGLPAGRYAAIALDFVTDGEWEAPEFLESLMRQAATIDVREGGSETVALTLEPPR